MITILTFLSFNCFSYGLTPQRFTIDDPKKKTFLYKVSNTKSKKTVYLEVVTEKVKLTKAQLYSTPEIVGMIQKSYDYDNIKVDDGFTVYPKTRRIVVKPNTNKTVMIKIKNHHNPYIYFVAFKDVISRFNKIEDSNLNIKKMYMRGGYIINTNGKKDVSVKNKGENTFQISNNEQGPMGIKVICDHTKVDFFIKEKTTLTHNFDDTCKVNEIRLITSGYDKIW